MEFYCYIIFSKSINRYYVGYTSNLDERLQMHRSGYFGTKSYTMKAKDWEIYLTFPCSTIEKAIEIEGNIKRMKSRKYIENLKKYPALVNKLLNTENPCAPSR